MRWWQCFPFFFLFYLNESKVMNYLKILSTFLMGSQVALVVKNLPDNSGDIRNAGWIPRLRRSASPGSMHDLPVQVRCMIQSALGWCTGMTQRDGMGREVGLGWGTHVHPWQIHVNVWQNQYNIVK